MVKKVKYIAIFVILFMTLSFDVDADVKEKIYSGNCIYNIPADNNSKYHNFKIYQGETYPMTRESIPIYYAETSGDPLTTVYNSKWEDFKNVTNYGPVVLGGTASATSGGHGVFYYKECPKYAYFYKKDNKVYAVFSDDGALTKDKESGETLIGASLNSSASDFSFKEVNDNGIRTDDAEKKEKKNSRGEQSGDTTSNGSNGNTNAACESRAIWLKKEVVDKTLNENEDGVFHCLYSSTSYLNAGDGCYVVQFDFDINDASKFVFRTNFKDWNVEPYSNNRVVFVENDFKDMVMQTGCPHSIAVGPSITYTDMNSHLTTNSDGTVGISWMVTRDGATTVYGGETYSGATYTFKKMTLVEMEPRYINIIGDKTKYENCGEILGDELVGILKNIVSIGRIIIPIILNVFGVIDFGSAIFAGDEEKMKKSQKKFIIRLLIGVVIFLIPSLLKLILDVAHSIWPVIDNSLCGILND